jgi:hypothetical protein
MELKAHCSICLCDIGKKEKQNILVCKHIFHRACINEWRENHITCPVCRVEMPLSCCEKCNVCINLPSSRCILELARVFLFPLIVLIIIVCIVVKADKIRE